MTTFTQYTNPCLLSAMGDFEITGLSSGATIDYEIYAYNDKTAAYDITVMSETLVAGSDGEVSILDIPSLLEDYYEGEFCKKFKFKSSIIGMEYEIMVYYASRECSDFASFIKSGFLTSYESKRTSEGRKELLKILSESEVTGCTARCYYADGTHEDKQLTLVEDEDSEASGTKTYDKWLEVKNDLTIVFHNFSGNMITDLYFDMVLGTGTKSSECVFQIDDDGVLFYSGPDSGISCDTVFTDLDKVYTTVTATITAESITKVENFTDKTEERNPIPDEETYTGTLVYAYDVDASPSLLVEEGKTILRYVILCGERTIEFVMDPEHEDCATAFFYQNGYGAMSTFYCNGKTEVDESFEREGTYVNGKYRNYKNTETKNYNCDTGIMYKNEVEAVVDILRSKQIYMCENDGTEYKKWKEVVITDSDVKYTDEAEDMPRYTFTCRLAQRRQGATGDSGTATLRIFTDEYNEIYS